MSIAGVVRAGMIAILLLATPVSMSGAQRVNNVTINLRGVEIEQAAQQIARITGRTLVLDPAVKGTITVVSSRPVSPAGAWEVFRSALRTNGFAAVRSGNIWRIVPQQAAVQGGSRPDSRNASRSDIVTRVIRLGNIPAADAQRALRPLVSSFGSIEATTRPNAVIVTDYAENIRRVEALARTLDGGGGASSTPGFGTIRLGNAGAASVGASIRRLLGDEASGGPRLAVDERSNLVIVRGTASQIAEARRIATSLDTPGTAQISTRVFRLRNSDAEAITEVLRGVLGAPGGATNPVARTLADGMPESAIGAGITNRFDSPTAPAILGAANAEILQNQLGLGQGGGAANEQQRAQGFSTPDLAITPAPEINAVVVRGSPAAILAIADLINQLDLRRPQVTIDVAIVELTGSAAEQLGVQIGLGAAAPFGTSGGTSFTNVGLSLGQILAAIGAPAGLALAGDGLSLNVGSRGDFGVLLQALGRSTKANLLSNPTLTTLDNMPAELVVGQNVPFRTGAFTTSGNSTNPFTTIEREDVGLTLRVVPRIHEGDVVKLEVSQEVSSLVNGTVPGAADLITDRRSIKTTVLADNGRTIVLGGLVTDDRLSGRSKVPLLGDIPVLGELFKSRTESRTKRVLFLFLRPTILRNQADALIETQRRYDRLRGEEYPGDDVDDLLTEPPGPRLPVEIDGVHD